MNEESENKDHECPLARAFPPKELIILLLRTQQEAMRDYKEWQIARGVNKEDDGNEEL